MNRLAIALGALLIAFCAVDQAKAQSKVQPTYGVTSTTGAQGQQPVDATHGLPVGALAVTSCGGQSLTEGVSYILTVDLTGKLCDGASGGITGVVTANQGIPNTAANAWTVKSGSYISAGTGQFALAVATNTQLTVPTGTICAQVTVETASIRRTSDGTSATTTNGTLIQAGAQWQDCGPLSSYKFTAVSGSPTLDVEYFK